MTQDRIAMEARITGKVQGVFFRAWTEEQAQELGLAGWVRNEPDGSVRALFVGPTDAVERMLRRCREGPSRAAVQNVEAEKVEPSEDIREFRVTG